MPKGYTISELSERTGLSVHALRYYEKAGVLRRVERTPSGRRLYSEASVGTLIGTLMLKQAGLTLPQVKEFFDLSVQGAGTLPQRLEILEAARGNLLDQQEQLKLHLQFVDYIIRYSKDALASSLEGDDPDASHPFLTAEGAFRYPYVRMKDGRLVPYVPDEEGE